MTTKEMGKTFDRVWKSYLDSHDDMLDSVTVDNMADAVKTLWGYYGEGIEVKDITVKKNVLCEVKRPEEIWPDLAPIVAMHTLAGDELNISITVNGMNYNSRYAEETFTVKNDLKEKIIDDYDTLTLERGSRTIEVKREWVKNVQIQEYTTNLWGDPSCA